MTEHTTSLLRLGLQRQQHQNLYEVVPPESLDQYSLMIWKAQQRYYREHPDAQAITDLGAWQTWLDMTVLANKDTDTKVLIAALVKGLVGPVDQILAGTLAHVYLQQALSLDTLKAIEAWNNESNTQDLDQLIAAATEKYKGRLTKVEADPVESSGLDDLFGREEADAGFHWRLKHLQESMRPLRPGDSIIWAARPDQGKCHGFGTPILMADGTIKKVEDVAVGDKVAGVSGPRTVLGTTTGQDQLYKVSYPWGESYVVNSAHILSLKRSKSEGTKHKTGEILNVNVVDYISWPTGRKHRYKGWKAGQDFSTKEQRMPAYLLGLWLGDGTSTVSAVTTIDKEVVQAFTDHYGPHSKCYNDKTYVWSRCSFRSDLQALGVFGNKHIPYEYLCGDRQQRLELLAGLVDSDGYVMATGVEIVTKLDSLRDGYLYLARSLGYHATSHKRFKRAAGTKDNGDWYNQVLIGSECLADLQTRLVRKRHTTTVPPKRKGLHFGITVEAIGYGDYAGFSLDGDHLYLLGDFTVTHNTSTVASEVSQMIPQLDQVFPGEKKSFLWLNNEGDTRNIRRRLYQAALGITYSEMLDMHEQGVLETALHRALGGKDLFDRALVLSVHQYSTTDILKLIRKHNAGLVVFDMLDNVKFTGSKINGGERTDEVLEELYRWVRDYASIEGYAAINTSQISAAGEGLAAPDMSMLKDSKTAKAGACEAIVMWGSTKDKPNSRFLGIPKNKLRLEGRRMNPNAECYFAPDICRVMTLEEAAKLYES